LRCGVAFVCDAGGEELPEKDTRDSKDTKGGIGTTDFRYVVCQHEEFEI